MSGKIFVFQLLKKLQQTEQVNFREYKIKKPERGIHSEAHALAKEISEFCNEPKKFAMYLGIVKNIGLRQAYRIFAEIKESVKRQTIKTPGKLFTFMSAGKEKKKNGNNKRTKHNSK